jgi:hypothetical protein
MTSSKNVLGKVVLGVCNMARNQCHGVNSARFRPFTEPISTGETSNKEQEEETYHFQSELHDTTIIVDLVLNLRGREMSTVIKLSRVERGPIKYDRYLD